MWSEQIEWTEQQILDIVKASQDDQHYCLYNQRWL